MKNFTASDDVPLAATNNKVDFSKLVPVDLGKKKLGSGAYASVKLVKDVTTGKFFAQKEVILTYPDRLETNLKERYDQHRERNQVPPESRPSQHY
jgi:hypothetical protein